MSQPEGRPAPYWKSPEDWYEFFHFACPGCKVEYVLDYGSHVPHGCSPRPVLVNARWDPREAKIALQATIICTCGVKFDVGGTS
jgi:hypothetical protein